MNLVGSKLVFAGLKQGPRPINASIAKPLMKSKRNNSAV